MRKLYMFAPAVMMLGTFAQNASASLQLTLTTGTTTINVTDCTLGTTLACLLAGYLDNSGAAGQITFNGSIGTWDLNVTTGTVGQNPLIDLSSNNTGIGSGTTAGGTALTLIFSATGYTESFNSSFVSTIGGTLAKTGSLSYGGYVDTTNALHTSVASPGTIIGSQQSFGPNTNNFPLGFNGTSSGASAAANSPFSLTQVVT